MDITIINNIPFEELEQKIRAVPLLQKREDGSSVKVYQSAEISFREVNPLEVNLTTFYLLEQNLQFQRELRDYLRKKNGIDTLHLDQAYELKNEKGEIWTITPPIIEVTPRTVKFIPKPEEISYPDQVTLQIPVVNDGAHRVWMAKESNEKFMAIYISGALAEYPFYAHPNEWSRVRIVETVPTKKEDKKMYSQPNCYGLYRDFGSLGCGSPRGTSK